jgi:hypothetical protein
MAHISYKIFSDDSRHVERVILMMNSGLKEKIDEISVLIFRDIGIFS